MISIDISSFLRPAISSVRLHTITSQIEVGSQTQSLIDEVDKRLQKIKSELDVSDISELPPNKFTRIAYKSLGKDPSRYRPSAEALLRRVVKDKGLYQVNNIVDIINLISVSSGYSIGGYDMDKINGDMVLKKGGSEPYYAIGRGELNIENLPVLYDHAGPFGSPTSDSQRTSISESTRNLLLVFFDFQPEGLFDETRKDTISLLVNHAKGKDFVYQQIDG